MSTKNRKKAVKRKTEQKTKGAEKEATKLLEGDVKPMEAIQELGQQIIEEAINIERGNSPSVWPLCKLAKQYQEVSKACQ